MVDLSVVKTLKLAGNKSAQPRLEVFNLFNRVNLDIPFNDPDGAAIFDDQGNLLPTAGRIFATSGEAREMQIAVRFLF